MGHFADLHLQRWSLPQALVRDVKTGDRSGRFDWRNGASFSGKEGREFVSELAEGGARPGVVRRKHQETSDQQNRGNDRQRKK